VHKCFAMLRVENEGQALLEYVLIMVMISLVSIVVVRGIASTVFNVYSGAAINLRSQIAASGIESLKDLDARQGETTDVETTRHTRHKVKAGDLQ
jgi:Flp pilus assembly pilin Flp